MDKLNCKTLTFFEHSGIEVVKLLSSLYFCNKLYLYFLEKKENLLFNSLFIIKDCKIIDYVCNLVNQQFEFELSPILDGSLFSKNLKYFLFYSSSKLDSHGNYIKTVIRSDFSPINNLVSYKCELKFNFNDIELYDKNLSKPQVFSFKNKYYLLAVAKKIATKTETLLLFSLSEFLNNPKLIKEINIKDIYETIDNYDIKMIDNCFALFATTTFKVKDKNDPFNSQISFYSIIDDVTDFLNESKDTYYLNNFQKVDVLDNFKNPIVFNVNNVNYLLGLVGGKHHTNLISSPRFISFEDNKLKFKIHDNTKKNINKFFDNKILYREIYLEDDQKVELLDDIDLMFTISYDGFDLKIVNHQLDADKETFIFINKNKCFIQILVDTNILEIYIDNSCVYSQIIEINKRILIHKNFIVKI